MSDRHGAETIKRWLEDFAESARSGEPVDTSAGADPGRDYAYLEYHRPDRDEHSILLFRVEPDAHGQPRVQTYRFDGDADDVGRRVDDLTHERPGG